MEKLTVGVIFGGRTVEHEVSVISALQAINALDKDKYRPVPIYISKQGLWFTGEALLELNNYRDAQALLPRLKQVYFSPSYGDWRLRETGRQGLFAKPWQCPLDVILPVLHGTHGEDGCLQGLLELSGIPYAGPGVLGAALGMDKIAMKAVLKEAGLPVTDHIWFTREEWQDNELSVLEKVEKALAYPLIVKPADLGSSIGIGMAADREELRAAFTLAAGFSGRIMAEEAIIPLRELNCAVLGAGSYTEVSCIEEPLSAAELLSFADKYLESAGGKGMSGAKRRIPAEIDTALADEITGMSRRAFAALDGAGVARIDFLYNTQTNRLYINELNTIPGSLAFYLFEPAGRGFSALLDELIHLALSRYRAKEKLIFTYDSDILQQGGFKGKK
ncbi:MAG: D-alanine--D-alanine ligase [Clostridiales bacterium]|nr:D-alanine--D-alanine ligase [Clostridiales bacterium]